MWWKKKKNVKRIPIWKKNSIDKLNIQIKNENDKILDIKLLKKNFDDVISTFINSEYKYVDDLKIVVKVIYRIIKYIYNISIIFIHYYQFHLLLTIL